ncbi:MAG: phage tail fiber protein [Phycicoccus sp.]
MPFTDAVNVALLDHLFTDAAYVPPTTLHIGLSSTTPTRAGGNITEPSTGAYARVSTPAASWATAAGAAPGAKSNGVIITFPTATADWLAGVNLTHFVLMSALTAGSCLAYGALTVAKPILNGDTASMAIGACVFRLGATGDAGL